MSEAKDMYDVMYEGQDAETQQKLSQLHDKIHDSIKKAPEEKFFDSIMKQAEQGKQMSINDIIGYAYAKSIAKDVIFTHVTGKDNEKLNFFDKIGQRFINEILKQKDTYDSVVSEQITKFKWELDDLKASITAPAENKEWDHEHAEGEEDYDYDDLEGWEGYADAKEFAFNAPIGLPIAWISKKDISSHKWHRKAPNAKASTDHAWLDIKVKVGTEIVAPGDGKVITVTEQPGKAGKYIEIDHGQYITRYFHLNTQDVKVGDVVKKWQKIATSWNTGNSTGPHLHYEVRNKNEIVVQWKKWSGKFKVEDPEKFLDFDGDGQVVALNSNETENKAA